MTTLIGPGVDAHTYDPAPADLVVLSEADVIFENGLGFEPWLDRFFASAQPSGARVVVTEGITPREAGDRRARGGGAGRGGADEHGQFDPHVWHDVANVDRHGRQYPRRARGRRPGPRRAVRGERRGLHRRTGGAGRLDPRAGRHAAGGAAQARHLSRHLRLLRRRLRFRGARHRARFALDRGGRPLRARHRHADHARSRRRGCRPSSPRTWPTPT